MSRRDGADEEREVGAQSVDLVSVPGLEECARLAAKSGACVNVHTPGGGNSLAFS